jgi:hypothetical protein
VPVQNASFRVLNFLRVQYRRKKRTFMPLMAQYRIGKRPRAHGLE